MPIEPLSVLAILIVGVLLGALIGWLAMRPAQARLQAALERDRALHQERVGAYDQAEQTFRDAFQALSAQALSQNNQSFLTLAETSMAKVRSESAADIDARKKAIEELLAPMKDTLLRMDAQINQAERQRVHDGASLLQRVASLDAVGRDLQSETRRLTDALKRPGVRGRWGELQLRRVVELAGMVERCDFDEQVTIDNGERRVRPDVIIRLPGGKQVVVDAKVPLDAYLRALEAPDEIARQSLLAEHARQVRTHLMQLGAKSYFTDVPASPEFVVMFLPGEMFFSAALEQDPTLIEFGVDRKVIPASPTTLIALLRAVAYGWQQEAMEENARKISELGRSLYDSIGTLSGHFANLGTKLKQSLDAYNNAVGSLEGNVLVKARKFREIQSASVVDPIEPVDVIDRVPRMLQARELTDGLPFAESDEETEPVTR
jgi:DNA recombination protein RmuC